MRRASALELLAVFSAVFMAFTVSAESNQVCRVYIEPMQTAAMFDSSIPKDSNSIDQRSVAMGRDYMRTRLAGPGRNAAGSDPIGGTPRKLGRTY